MRTEDALICMANEPISRTCASSVRVDSSQEPPCKFHNKMADCCNKRLPLARVVDEGLSIA